jgi:perosamine synthetase
MTFASTAEVVRYFNAYPVLVDCNEDDLCMDMSKAADILEKLSRKEKVNGVPEDFAGIRAMIPVHYGGQVADVIKCGELRDKYAIALIEDCAHTCPAYFKDASGKWQMAGSTADVACFSFYANKTITTGEGGMAVTNNRDWADRMRIMSLHGISKDAWKRFDKSGSWYYEITAPGFKYNMPDTAAAIGIHQLKKADRFFEQRRAIARRLIEGLRDIPGIITPVEKPDRKHSWHLFIIRVNNPPSGIDRNTFIEKLKEKGIGTSVHYMPLHMHPYYMKKYLYCNEDFPVATKIFNQIISLPIYPGLTDNEIQRILDAVKKTALGD